MKNSDIKLQESIKENLSDIDELSIGEDGAHIVKYLCKFSAGTFPCASLSLALSCAKKLILDGKTKIIIEVL